MKRYCPAITFLLPLLIGVCSPHVNLHAHVSSRPPNEHELFYTAVAANFADLKMCEKISKRALDEMGPDFWNSEWRVIVSGQPDSVGKRNPDVLPPTLALVIPTNLLRRRNGSRA